MSRLIRILSLLLIMLCAVPLLAQDADSGYQEALRRIEEAKQSGATELILTLNFRELPPEIGQLSHLESLFIYDSPITHLPAEIGQLTKLRMFLVADTQLSSLPPEIGQLSNLEYLMLKRTHLTALPPEIGCLARLEVLDLRNNKIKSLPPEIGQLHNLRLLLIPGNQLSRLPLELANLVQLEEIDIYDNPLQFPPTEIMKQDTPAILAYLGDYEAMLMRQTVAGMAAGVGGIALVMLAFRRRQRAYRGDKKKRDDA